MLQSRTLTDVCMRGGHDLHADSAEISQPMAVVRSFVTRLDKVCGLSQVAKG